MKVSDQGRNCAVILSLFLHHILLQQPCNALGSHGKDCEPKVKVVHGKEPDVLVESKTSVHLVPVDFPLHTRNPQ
jgi:hypothetical protein